MCGIVAAVSQRNIVPILIEGLKRLEYRGYDSAGIAILNGRLQRVRSTGRVVELEKLAGSLSAPIGIAHTRWATHGIPSERNAHPQVSGGVSVVHNGIIENHDEIRDQLKARGYGFSSDTDTEVIAHLVHERLVQGASLFEAVCQASALLQGAYAIAVVNESDPDLLVVARHGAPLLLGLARESVRLSGGNLELETAPDVGSRIRVSFPLADATVSVQAADVPRGPGQLRGRVLLIEEDELLRRALHRFLGEQHEVHPYASIPEALAYLGNEPLDAAVVSFPRPEGVGLRLLERFAAAAPSLHRNAIVVVPPGIRHSTRERLVSQGSVVVPRPVDFTLLRSVLLRMMPLEELVGDSLEAVEPDS